MDHDAILAIMERYRRAYNGKDLNAIKEVYPTVPEDLFGRGGRDCSSFDLRFVGPPIVQFLSVDAAALVTVSWTYKCIPKSKSAERVSPVVVDKFEFGKKGGEWVIQDHLIRRGK